MLSVGFEPTISAGERPQTYALDCAATGAGQRLRHSKYKVIKVAPSVSCFELGLKELSL
jgi:hypothetical protein